MYQLYAMPLNHIISSIRTTNSVCKLQSHTTAQFLPHYFSLFSAHPYLHTFSQISRVNQRCGSRLLRENKQTSAVFKLLAQLIAMSAQCSVECNSWVYNTLLGGPRAACQLCRYSSYSTPPSLAKFHKLPPTFACALIGTGSPFKEWWKFLRKSKSVICCRFDVDMLCEIIKWIGLNTKTIRYRWVKKT